MDYLRGVQLFPCPPIQVDNSLLVEKNHVNNEAPKPADKRQEEKTSKVEWPSWLVAQIPLDIPKVRVDDSGVDKIAKAASTHPMSFVQYGPTDYALYLKVQVKHVNLDDQYDELRRIEAEQDRKKVEEMFGTYSRSPSVPSSEPFILHLLISKNGSGDLQLTTKGPLVHHRHKNQTMSGLFELFHSVRNLDPNPLVGIERQDDLPKGAERSLEWLVLRLMREGSLEVREDDSFFPDFKEKAVGRWRVSLAED